MPQCRARGAHIERAHEQVVQRDIRRARHGDEVHRTFRIAQPAGSKELIML